MKHYESISNYNDMLYDSRPVTLNEYVSDKYNIIHKELFNDALDKYIKYYVSKFINNNFLYNLLYCLELNENYEQEFVNLLNDKNSTLYEILSLLEINSKQFLLDITDILDNHINSIIDYLVNNDIATIMLYSIIKITKNRINDFRKYKNKDVENYYCNIVYNENGYIYVSLEPGINYIDDNVNNNLENLIKTINENIYNDIFNKACEYYKKSHRIIELKNTEYWMPSEVLIIHNGKPFTKNKIDLTKYWNYYQKMSDFDISKLKLTNENILDSEVTYLDYIKGSAKMYSKVNDIEYEIPFKYLDENSKVSKDMQLTNTFGYYL